LRWLAVVLVLALGLGAAAWWKRDVFLKHIAARALARHTGMRVEIASFQAGPAPGAMTFRGVRLYNFPEFGNGVLLDAPELAVELDEDMAATGQLKFRKLRLNLAELSVIQDAAGRWNFEKLEKEMTERNAARTKQSKPRLVFAGIDDISLTLDRVRYTDLKRPERSRDIRVCATNETATGIRTEEQLQEWIGSFLFRVILREVAAEPRRQHKARDALKDALDR